MHHSATPSVKEWLASLGLSEYADRFAVHRIDLSILQDLTDKDLKEELGIVPLGDRRRLLRAIAELASSTTPKFGPGSESKQRDEAERRQVTVMFADLVGSTALSTGMDPEDMREVISAYQKCVAEAVSTSAGSSPDMWGMVSSYTMVIRMPMRTTPSERYGLGLS
jgi:hypothetical protein